MMRREMKAVMEFNIAAEYWIDDKTNEYYNIVIINVLKNDLRIYNEFPVYIHTNQTDNLLKKVF